MEQQITRSLILRYVTLNQSSLERKLTKDENTEKEDIQRKLSLAHEEILLLGKKIILADDTNHH